MEQKFSNNLKKKIFFNPTYCLFLYITYISDISGNHCTMLEVIYFVCRSHKMLCKLLSQVSSQYISFGDYQFIQSLSRVHLFATPRTAACQAPLSNTNSQSLLKLMSVESVMTSNHLILCHPLLFPPSIFPSITVISNESFIPIRWPKYWSFSFSISPSNEYSGLISFRMDWLDLLAVQGTLQHHSSKASIPWCSAFFIVQLSHPYMTTGKTIALTRRTFAGKVTSLLFNMLSRLAMVDYHPFLFPG